MRAPRLLALTSSREEGGAESHLRTTLGAVAEAGYEVHVAMPAAPGTARMRRNLTTAGFRETPLELGRTTQSRLGAYLAMAYDLAVGLYAIARVRPDVVLLNLPTPEAMPGVMAACAITGVRTTAIFHLVRTDLEVTPIRRRLYGAIARSRQTWICVSDHNRNTLATQFGVERERIVVVRNGADVQPAATGTREFVRADLGVAEDATLVLTLGRLGEQKAHRLIVEALPRLAGADSRLVFVWAGDGPLRDELAAAIDAAGLGSRVLMLGHRDDVSALLAAADLFLMPSRDEGSPLALAEAMLAGVPVVVSDAGALTEMVEDGRTGLVFGRDDADDLVRVVTRATQEPERMRDLARDAQAEAVRQFTRERMIAALLPHLTAGPG